MNKENTKMKNKPKQPAYFSWPFFVDHVETYAFVKDAFNDEEIDKIISHCKQFQMKKGVTEGNKKSEKIRDSNISFISPENIDWLFRKLTSLCENLNNQFFKFELQGFLEGLQFTEYKAPHQHYTWHKDKAFMQRVRKLSIVVQLTDEDEYEGGDLEILIRPDDKPLKTPRSKGTLIAFPSYEIHRVSPVTKGTRHSLVGWITGYPFK